MPTLDGYPTDDELLDIADFEGTPRDFADLIDGMWWHTGFAVAKGKDIMGKPIKRLTISTWGWSGNETVMDEMQKTLFWLMYWHESKRGGHYTFEVPLEAWQSEDISPLGRLGRGAEKHVASCENKTEYDAHDWAMFEKPKLYFVPGHKKGSDIIATIGICNRCGTELARNDKEAKA